MVGREEHIPAPLPEMGHDKTCVPIAVEAETGVT